jgi:dTDP-4-amino-4,6-dideoxygalactose transaminase
MYRELAKGQSFPIAERLAARGFNLPSFATLSEADVDFVCDQLLHVLETSTE